MSAHKPDRTSPPPRPDQRPPVEDTRSGAGGESAADPNRTAPLLPGGEDNPPSTPATPASSTDGVSGYEILDELGHGGMGVVYRARHVKLNRLVALKMMRGREAVGRGDLIRFLAEAEAVAAIKHENVVQVFDYGEADGRPFMALEYLAGGSLAALLRNGHESVTSTSTARGVAKLVRDVARGVAAAHALGIVHRDLKPANVLLDEHGVPKVADFGLAKRGPGADITQPGQVMGTPAYMSPEQAGGETKFVGPQADVWALGVILYEAVTGDRPFNGTVKEILTKLQHADPVPPRRACGTVPRDLELICLRCLAKQPHERYPTARELADDLGRFVRGEPISVRPAGPVERAYKWVRRNPVVSGAAAAVVLALAAGAGVSLAFGFEARRQSARATRAAGEAEREAARAFALAASEAAAKEEAKANERKAVAGEAAAGRLFARVASAEGLRVADDGDLYGGLLWLAEALRRDPDDRPGSSPNRVRFATYLRHAPRFRLAAVHPVKGQVAAFDHLSTVCLVVGPEGELRLYSTESGEQIGAAARGPTGVQSAALSPDGVVAAVIADNHLLVHHFPLGATVTRPVATPMPMSATRQLLSFDPATGALFYPASPGLFELADPRTLAPINGPYFPQRQVTATAVSRDGNTLAGADFTGGVSFWNRATRRQVPPTIGMGGPVTSMAIAPDGERIALGGESGEVRLWTATPAVRPPAGGPPGPPPFFPPNPNPGLGPPPVPGPPGAANPGPPVASRFLMSTTLTPGHQAPITQVLFHPSGNRLASASFDRTVRVWDSAVGKAVGTPLRHEGPVESVGLSGSGGVVYSGTSGLLRAWRPAASHPSPVPLPGSLRDARPGFDSVLAIAAVGPEQVVLIDAMTGRQLGLPLSMPPDSPRGFASATHARLSPDGTSVALGRGAVARVWDGRTGRPRTGELAHAQLSGLKFSGCGRYLVTWSGQSARVWEVATGRQLGDDRPHVSVLRSEPAISPRGRRLACINKDRLTIHDLGGSSAPVEFSGASGDVHAVNFSPDETWVAVASGSRAVRVWDAKTGTPVGPVLDHDGSAAGLLFSPDGTRLATRSDKIARVWDVRSGRPLAAIPHAQPVRAVAFASGGTRVATVTSEAGRVWDVADGLPLAPAIASPPGNPLATLSFSAGGERVLAGGRTRTTGALDLRGDTRPVADLLKIAELYAGRRLDAAGGIVPLTPAEVVTRWTELRGKYPEEFGPDAPAEPAPQPRAGRR